MWRQSALSLRSVRSVGRAASPCLAGMTGTATRRLSTHHKQHHTHPAHLGFAFDIDGVLLKGKKVLKQATHSLSLLNAKKIPYILLTNGGGVTEEAKATELSHKLNAHIHPSQVVLSHSPMHALASKYADKIVLVVGKNSCKDVALSYGFRRPVHPDDVFAWNPAMWPFKSPAGIEKCDIDFSKEPISAVLVFHDSRDWGRDIQIIIDLMRSKGGFLATETDKSEPQSLPLYFSNSDFVWSNDYPVNRFAQGAFRLALEALYVELTGGQTLQYTKFGKPEHATYKYATDMLQAYARTLWPNEELPCRKVYAVGDNPASDIHGANQHGWESILVRTGVWKESHGHNHGAGHVVHDVQEAVHWALEKERIQL
ncbi:HAD-like domain-containing protein [Entophlyctis helioformis]|nr:HAD-like domain-containing protein [Entophlyctis helioformis]